MSITNALNIAKTGMTLQETSIAVKSQNLAAVGADSFQKLYVIAKDLPYVNQVLPGAPTSGNNTVNQTGVQMGLGVQVSSISRSLKHGDLIATTEPFDLAINGNGYYQVQLPTGEIAYTRVASFRVDSQTKQLTTIEGYPLVPSITIPDNASDFMVSRDGIVQVSIQGSPGTYQQLGQIQLTTFTNERGLKAIGDTMFSETPASGTANIENPTSNNKGAIMQFYRETSNVNAVEEITDLIKIQQGYEALTKVISTCDSMLASANQRIA